MLEVGTLQIRIAEINVDVRALAQLRAPQVRVL